MANYDIVKFIVIMQHLIDKYTFFCLKVFVQMLLANKEIKRKSGLFFSSYFQKNERF